MKFIFPQNYNFKNKLFGVIDYSTAFVNCIWDIFVFIISNFFFSSLSLKVFILIVLCFPLLLFSFVGFHGENIIYVFSYSIGFLFKQKLFLYKKQNKFE